MLLRLIPSIALALSFSAAMAAQEPATGPAEKTVSVLPLEDLRVFTKAYEHIRSSYIHEIDDKKLLEYAIRGMLDQLDPHSSYLDASSFDDLQVHTTGEFGGLGIEVGMEDGFVKVISPIDDTPAQRAGIEAGDFIIKIDDTTLKGLSLNDAVARMRGPKGSKIVLTIVREGRDQPFDVTLVRDTIKVRSVRSEVLDKSFLYLRIAQFQMNTGSDVTKAITDAMKKHTLKGVILDLRNNPGGVLQASVEVADAFLDGGKVVYTEGRMPHANLNYEAEPGDITQGLPLVVLINEGSASASEIVAGALQDHRRALVMGTRSFGKGSVQTVIPITDDKAVKLTTALYFTPGGRSIQAQGIEPDIVIERASLTALQGRTRITEAQLAGHLNNANGGKDIKSQERAQERDSQTADLQSRDNQLYEALNMLKGLTFFKASGAANAVPQTP
jgi:carboxyl-terminal processing protease